MPAPQTLLPRTSGLLSPSLGTFWLLLDLLPELPLAMSSSTDLIPDPVKPDQELKGKSLHGLAS